MPVGNNKSKMLGFMECYSEILITSSFYSSENEEILAVTRKRKGILMPFVP
jgi:hypothetical protein